MGNPAGAGDLLQVKSAGEFFGPPPEAFTVAEFVRRHRDVQGVDEVVGDVRGDQAAQPE
ncbi:hypothetical protein [Nocardia fusca]|uniref:Uncharacterized protein n=1 Tax=Nocardia fusca TaxID=941183 RepID=A0ABV3FG46_9NOCA